MPELPEVESARKLLDRTCVGKRILVATIAEDEKVFQGVTSAELKAGLEGRRIEAAHRHGKQLWLELDGNSPALLVHFGMTGGMVVQGLGAAHYKNFSIDDSTWPPRFWKFALELEGGVKLAFCDSRRFAKVLWQRDPRSQPPLSKLGWDPLLSMPLLEEFKAGLARCGRAVKALLLDQSFSAGVGNWVADEVLYQSRIHPEQPANTLTAEQAASLHEHIRSVCQLASDVDADHERFPEDWLFHERWGKGSAQASTIGGHRIEHITVGGRTSAIVPALQKLRKSAPVVAAAAAGAAAAKAKAGGGRSSRGKKAAAAVAVVAEVAAEVVAAVEAAVEGEVLQQGKETAAPARAAKRGGGRGKKATAAAAKDETEAAEAVPADGKRHSARTSAAAAVAAAAPAAAKPGQGRSFRGRAAAAASGKAPAAKATSGSKRKSSAAGGAAGVKRTRG